jgi:type 1 fimbria pilin
MRRIALLSGIGMLSLAPLAAGAVETANLQVTGTISPAACDVSVVGSPTVSLGTINVSQFEPGKDLALGEKTASLRVDCQNGSARFRLKASDGQGGYPGLTLSQYSLGTHQESGSDKLNGFFALSIDASSMTSPFVLKSTDSGEGKVWGAPTTGEVAFDHDGEAFAFAASQSATEPDKLNSLLVPLKIAAVLKKDPVVTEEIALEGRATIEIFY